MSQEPPVPENATPVDSTDGEDAALLLTDPDDYHRTQRLKAIHEARNTVRQILTDIDTYTSTDEHRSQEGQLAHAVSAYGMELIPLIQDLDEFDTTLPDRLPWDTLEGYLARLGHTDQKSAYNVHALVFQRFNDALAEIEPLLEEDDSQDAEFDYSELLQDNE